MHISDFKRQSVVTLYRIEDVPLEVVGCSHRDGILYCPYPACIVGAVILEGTVFNRGGCRFRGFYMLPLEVPIFPGLLSLSQRGRGYQ